MADRLHLLEISWQMCHDHHQHSDAPPGYESNSWWEIPSVPLDDLGYHREHSCLPPNTIFFISFWHYILLTCRWIAAEPIGHILIFQWWNCTNYSSSSRGIRCESKSLTFTWWPCQCYPEACLWYSDRQQEHWKRNAKCFMIDSPNPVVWVTTWIPSTLYLVGYLLTIMPWISSSACPWEGNTPYNCV